MASNIAASILDTLTPDIIGKLAAASGLDGSVARQAVSAAVPSILNSVVDLATKPGGARKIMTAVTEQSSDLEGFANSLVGPAQAAASGSRILSSLLGSRTPNVLSSGIANWLGISTNAVQTILGLLTPFVLGGLRRIQRARDLDADGLAQMLAEQQGNIAEAIPAGLAGYLRKSGLMDDGIRSGQAATRVEGARSTPPMAAMAPNNPAASKSVSWPYWMLAIAALGGLLWALLPRQDEGQTESAAVTDRSALPRTGEKVIYIVRPRGEWTSVGTSPNEFVNRVIYNANGEALGTIRDLLVESDGKAAAAVIGVGRYLGIGDKVVAVPFTALRMEQHDSGRRIVIDLGKEALQSAPQYENIPASTR